MRDFIILFVHAIVSVVRLAGPGGLRSVVTESALIRHQLLILDRGRKRAPNLRASDRIAAGLFTLFMSPAGILRSAIVMRPSTLLHLHSLLRKRKYPTNLADFTPSFRIPNRANLLIAVESPFYFRSSPNDGVYGIDLALLLDGQHTKERYVGTNPGVVLSWQPARHINVSGAITRFLSGPFLTGTAYENGFNFYSVTLTYRF